MLAADLERHWPYCWLNQALSLLSRLDEERFLEQLAARALEEASGSSPAADGERTVIPLAADVTDLPALKSLAAEVEEKFGPIDVLIANAGTHIPTSVEKFDAAQYEKIMRVNFFGQLNCIEAVLPGMIERKSGHIVGVASVAGYRALPKAGAYGASKAALIHFLDSIRFDLIEHGVDVTVVNPGFVRTPLTDKNDFEMPYLMEVEPAAKTMLAGIEKRKFEVHFPKVFTCQLKLMRIIPFSLYYQIIKRLVLK